MKLPELEKSEKYVGLYAFDFGDYVSVGFTAQEVAELFESEHYKDGKAYKIYKAYPDGKIELKGVGAETFQLESGMFFYSNNIGDARRDLKGLTDLAIKLVPPCRSKVHLAEHGEGEFVVGIIYPSEYEDEVSSWLLDGEYKTNGAAEGGVGAVQRYYDNGLEVLERSQLFGTSEIVSKSGEELLANLKMALQR